MKAILKNILLFTITAPVSFIVGLLLGMELGILFMLLGINIKEGPGLTTLGMIVIHSPIPFIQAGIMYFFWSE